MLSQEAHPGEVVAPAAPILTVANLDRVTLVVYVAVNHIGRVRLGQEVQVTVDSFPGETFSGQVTGIGAEPEFTPRNVATAEERINTFYEVEISLPNPDLRLKPGMPADAQFTKLTNPVRRTVRILAIERFAITAMRQRSIRLPRLSASYPYLQR